MEEENKEKGRMDHIRENEKFLLEEEKTAIREKANPCKVYEVYFDKDGFITIDEM